jgi:chorismate mutase
MLKNYLIVDKKSLPDFFEKVVEARQLIESKAVSGVSDAVKAVGISRSTYYKYKDAVFEPSQEFGKKATLSFFLKHESGVLAEVIDAIANNGGNIITIHQDIPIHRSALVSITLDTINLNCSIVELIKCLEKFKGVTSVSLVAIE